MNFPTMESIIEALAQYGIAGIFLAVLVYYLNKLTDIVARASTALVNESMAYMTYKRTGSANSSYSPRTYVMHYAGAGMTALEHADFYAATQTFFTTLGVAV